MAKIDPRAQKRATMAGRVGDSQRAKADLSITYMGIDDIEEHPKNEFSMDEGKIIELALDIEKNDLIEIPSVWSNAENKTELLSGHRRRRAFLWLRDHRKDTDNEIAQKYDNWNKMPVRIRSDVKSDAQALLILHAANVHNRDLKPSEKAHSIAVVYNEADKLRLEDESLTGIRANKIVADALSNDLNSVSQATVSRMVKLDTKLIAQSKTLWDNGIITRTQAEELCKLSDAAQERFCELAKTYTEQLKKAEFDILRGQLVGVELGDKPKRGEKKSKVEKDINKEIKSFYRSIRKTATNLIKAKEAGAVLDQNEIDELKTLVNQL